MDHELLEAAAKLEQDLKPLIAYVEAEKKQTTKLGPLNYVTIWLSFVPKSEWPHNIYQNTKRVIVFLGKKDDEFVLEMIFNNTKKRKMVTVTGDYSKIFKRFSKWILDNAESKV